MDSTLLAVIVSALVCAVGSAAVPALVRSVPEPEPAPELAPVPDAAAGLAAEAASAAGPAAETPVPEVKPAYRDLASHPRLRWAAPLVGAVAGAMIGAAVGWDPRLVAWCAAVPVLVALCWIDSQTRLLPNHLMWPLIGLVTVLGPLATWLAVDLGRAGWVLVGAVGSWLFYYLLWWINASGIGFGDVRLSWVLGLLLATAGLAEVLAGLWLGFAIGGVGGLLLGGGVRGSLKRKVPFGPFMVIGALVGLLSGQAMLSGLVG